MFTRFNSCGIKFCYSLQYVIFMHWRIEVDIFHVYGNIILRHILSFSFIVASNAALPCYKVLVFLSPLTVLETFHSARCVRAANVVSKHIDIFEIKAVSCILYSLLSVLSNYLIVWPRHSSSG
jgi:hypothetical protein